MSDRRAAAGLLGRYGPNLSNDQNDHCGCRSPKPQAHKARLIKAEGYELRIVKRRKRAFEVVGLTWIVERTFAWSDGTGA
jgi:hypothetical protein